MSGAAAGSAAPGVAIFVNDQPRPLGGDGTLAALAAELGFAGRAGVAVAVNDQVVPRSAWAGHRLNARDRVLVIRATQGG